MYITNEMIERAKRQFIDYCNAGDQEVSAFEYVDGFFQMSANAKCPKIKAQCDLAGVVAMVALNVTKEGLDRWREYQETYDGEPDEWDAIIGRMVDE